MIDRMSDTGHTMALGRLWYRVSDPVTRSATGRRLRVGAVGPRFKTGRKGNEGRRLRVGLKNLSAGLLLHGEVGTPALTPPGPNACHGCGGITRFLGHTSSRVLPSYNRPFFIT